jgi:hypothetical protein
VRSDEVKAYSGRPHFRAAGSCEEIEALMPPHSPNRKEEPTILSFYSSVGTRGLVHSRDSKA